MQEINQSEEFESEEPSTGCNQFTVQAILGDRVLYEWTRDDEGTAREDMRRESTDPTSEADQVRILTNDGECVDACSCIEDRQ
jgi:hypothetical protein